MFDRFKPYSKFIVALLGAVLTTVSQFYGDNTYVTMLISLLTALGVYQAKNEG